MSPRHHDPCPSLPLSPSPLRSPDIAKRLITALTDSGTVTIMETTSVKAGGYARAAAGTHEREREKEGPPLSLTLSDDSTLVCDVFMAAAGRTPNTGWLEGTGVGLGKRGHIEVDSKLQSSSRAGVWAAGDVLPPPSAALASTAVEEGARAVSAMFGEGETDEEKEGEEVGGVGGGGGGGGSEFPCGIWTIPEVGEFRSRVYIKKNYFNFKFSVQCIHLHLSALAFERRPLVDTLVLQATLGSLSPRRRTRASTLKRASRHTTSV